MVAVLIESVMKFQKELTSESWCLSSTKFSITQPIEYLTEFTSFLSLLINNVSKTVQVDFILITFDVCATGTVYLVVKYKLQTLLQFLHIRDMLYCFKVLLNISNMLCQVSGYAVGYNVNRYVSLVFLLSILPFRLCVCIPVNQLDFRLFVV